MADPTPTSVPTLTVPPPADVTPLLQDRERDVKAAQQRQGRLDQTRDATAAAQNRELAPLEDKVQKTQAELQQLTPPKPTELPEWKPKPVIDAKDYQSFSTALIGMAVMGGVVSKGNWLGVSSSLNGALQGYLDGNKARADKELTDYKTKFAEAKAHDAQAQNEFESILNNKNLSINSILSQIKIAAAKYGREDIRQAAEQKSIDGIWKQVEATDRSIAQLESQNERTAIQLALGNARIGASKGGVQDLDENGKWLVEQTALGGNFKFLDEVKSRYGGELAAHVVNDMAGALKAAGVDPRTLTEGQISNAVQKAVQQNLNVRLARIDSLTNSLQQMEKELTRVTERVNGTNPNLVNKALNSFQGDKIGDEDIKELELLSNTVGRMYVEAATMPGSNAQMHAGSQEFASHVTSRDFSLNSLAGALKAVNLEISSEQNSLKKQIQDSAALVSGQGQTLPVPGVGGTPGATLPPQAPPSGKVLTYNPATGTFQ